MIRRFGLLFVPVLMLAGAPRTVLEGVYTEAQATRGQTTYEANRASCHQSSLEGNPEAPPLKGSRFLESWRDDYLEGLYTHIRTRMPRRPGGEPGSLSDTAYADIVAWILKSNDYPAGKVELTPELMRTTLFIGPDGPRPLPTNALVQVVGCLEPALDDNWMVTNATEPVRTRDAEKTTPEELKLAAAMLAGTGKFSLRLQTLIDNHPEFKPEPLKSSKVQVKGVLTRQTNNDRITVLSLASAAPGCKP
jgi:mono/diheme cytochrome c family protein